MTTAKFESGKTYARHGVHYRIVNRTKCFATLETDAGEPIRKAIREWENDTEIINLAEWPELDYLFAKNGGEYSKQEEPATEPEPSQQAQPAKYRKPLTLEQKNRRKSNALMRKLDDFGKQVALKQYREGREYSSTVLEGLDGVTERDHIEAYLMETWTFDELFDLCRALNVKRKGYRDFSFEFDYELIDPILDVITLVGGRLYAENNLQEEKTMTQTTVSEAVAAVKEATTTESIRDALMACTVKDMVKVCTEVTGVENAVKTGGLKAQTAERIADFIMKDRKEKAFKALPLAEKYAAMTEKKYSEIAHLSSWCSVEELKEIARMLYNPLDEEEANDMEYCLSMINTALLALNKERRIMERIAARADKKAVKNELYFGSYGVHEVLMRRAGIELKGALPLDVIIDRLASHFMKCNQPTPPANPEPEKRTATFKPGTIYCYGLTTHNPGDIEYFVPCRIVSRTANSVVFFDAEKGINIRKRIYVNDRWGEYFYPFGRYKYAMHVSAFDTQEHIEQRQENSPEHVILCNAPTLKPRTRHEGNPPTPPEQPEPPAPKPEINPEDTSLAEYEMLQAWINVSMSVRSALKTAMKVLDPKSKDYSVLDELYYCEGRDIEEYVERRKVIHKAITALRGVRLKENNLLGVA